VTTLIRLATEADSAVVQAIYAPIVESTIISFEIDVPTVEEIRERIRAKVGHLPWLVCEYENQVTGYVYAGKHRERAGYQWSVDVSAYVSDQFRRAGIARALYTSLFEILKLQGFYNAYAGIALPNNASIGLHTALGFQPVGVYRHVGYKLGAWHDVSWLYLTLLPPADNPIPPVDLHHIQHMTEWQEALSAGLSLLRLSR
jgi:L-amino acid N-acyltransferase YncA